MTTYIGNELFASWLSDQLSKSNLTIYSLSDKTGITVSSLENWYRGKNLPKIANLIMMCEVFGTCQGRSPRQMVFEAMMNVAEMSHAEIRWKKKNGCL